MTIIDAVFAPYEIIYSNTGWTVSNGKSGKDRLLQPVQGMSEAISYIVQKKMLNFETLTLCEYVQKEKQLRTSIQEEVQKGEQLGLEEKVANLVADEITQSGLTIQE